MSVDALATIVREGDRDRYVATLLAPAAKRPALTALHAFDLELSRIPRLARQQIAGEIRLQWWREAVDGSNEHEALANPVAAALIAAVAMYGLPRDALHAMIDAHGRELSPEPFADEGEMLAWCDGTVSQHLRCACRVLDPVQVGKAEAAAIEAGRALGITQLLMSFAARAARGQSAIPAALLRRHGGHAGTVTAGSRHDGVVAALTEMRTLARRHLGTAVDLLRTLPASLKPAFLLLDLVGPRLAWLDNHESEPYASGDVPSWRRMWLMWRAH